MSVRYADQDGAELPLALSSFTGRESEIAQLEPQVLTQRFVTLTRAGAQARRGWCTRLRG